MILTEFDRDDLLLRIQLAELLSLTWPHQYEQGDEEVQALLKPERIAIAALEEEELVGFAGAIPQYGKTGWELHPVVVAPVHRGQNIGQRLLDFVEEEVAASGGVTLYLGTDDEFGQTSLSQTDLFEAPFEKIASIQNLDRHPYEFYQKQGYQIVGVIPDANGIGKPDIWMAKKIGRNR